MARYMMGIRVPDYQQVSVPGGAPGYIPVWTPPAQQQTQTETPTGGGGGGGGGGDGDTPSVTVVGTYTKREKGGWVRTYERLSDGTSREIDAYQDRSAGDSAAEMFRIAGLDQGFIDQLMGIIDKVYNDNVAPTTAQFLSSIYNSEPYKKRFAANEVIRQRIADGSGRPGDRLLSPAEYIALENTYREIFQNAEMPTGYYDTPEDFTNLISNSISAAELKSRVDTAYDAINRADANVVGALQQYYNLNTNDLVAYLLDPEKALPLMEGRATATSYGLNSRTELQRMYGAAQVGGTAARTGLDVGKSMSEEIVDLGKADQAEGAFQQGAAANDQLKRLGSLYGEALDFKDLVKETLNLSGGVESGKKRRKFASKERAAFGGQGALSKKSLSRMQDV